MWSLTFQTIEHIKELKEVEANLCRVLEGCSKLLYERKPGQLHVMISETYSPRHVDSQARRPA